MSISRRFDWQGGVREISAGDKPHLRTPPPFSFPQAHVSSLSLGTDLNQAVV